MVQDCTPEVRGLLVKPALGEAEEEKGDERRVRPGLGEIVRRGEEDGGGYGPRSHLCKSGQETASPLAFASQAHWQFEQQITEDQLDGLNDIIAEVMNDDKYSKGREEVKKEIWAYQGEGIRRTVDCIVGEKANA